MLPCLLYSSPRYLLLSPYIIHVPSLISITASLLVPACLCSRHGFQCILMTWIYRYTCAYPMLATWLSHHHSPGSSDSSGSSCPGFGAWSVWIPSVADQSGAAVAWISSRLSRAASFQAPLFGSRVSCLSLIHI